jgi:hypothetical protein
MSIFLCGCCLAETPGAPNQCGWICALAPSEMRFLLPKMKNHRQGIAGGFWRFSKKLVCLLETGCGETIPPATCQEQYMSELAE